MNLLPIEIYMFLLLVIPVGICFAKWRYSLKWLVAFAVCAVCSWLYLNSMMAFASPDNGLANFVYLLTGWFWLLPILGLFAIIFRLIERRISESTRLKIGNGGFKVCLGITIAILIWNLFGWTSAGRAVNQARSELRRLHLEPKGREIPKYKFFEGHWIVYYPDTSFGAITLSRNGKLRWTGTDGPG